MIVNKNDEKKTDEKKTVDDFMEALEEKDHPNHTKKNKSPLFIIGVILLFISILCVSGYYIYKALPKNQTVEQTDKIAEDSTSKDNPTEETKVSPISLPEWAKKQWDKLSEQDIEQMIADNTNTFIGWHADALPSEEDGFTSDPNKEFEEDGLPNLQYTELTKKEFTQKMSSAIHRIVNPIFGGWVNFQYPDSGDILNNKATVKDLVDTDYLVQILKDPEKSVFLTDANKDNYNNAFKEVDLTETKKARFIGKIRKGEIEQNDKEYIVNLEVDYMKSATEKYLTKKIKLTFILENKNFILKSGEISNGE